MRLLFETAMTNDIEDMKEEREKEKSESSRDRD